MLPACLSSRAPSAARCSKSASGRRLPGVRRGARAIREAPTFRRRRSTRTGSPCAPERELLAVTYMGRGRGALAGLALAGLVAFFLPWVRLTMPDIVSYSGVSIAMRLGWAWGAGVAWFVLVPTVLTRRSIMQMRGARVAASFLAAVPGHDCGPAPRAHPARRARRAPAVHLRAWGLYGTLGPLARWPSASRCSSAARSTTSRCGRGTSAGQIVH